MAAEKRDAGTSQGPRRAGRMEGGLGVEVFASFGLVGWRMNGASAGREAGTFLRDSCEAGLFAAKPLHSTHHAVMFAISAAAGGKARLGVGSKQRRNQHPTEEHHQRKCDHAPHSQIIQLVPRLFDGLPCAARV